MVVARRVGHPAGAAGAVALPREPTREALGRGRPSLVALLALMLLAFGGIVVRLTRAAGRGPRDRYEALGLDQRLRTFDAARPRGARSSIARGVPLGDHARSPRRLRRPRARDRPAGEAEPIADAARPERPRGPAGARGRRDDVRLPRAAGRPRRRPAQLEEMQLPGIGFLAGRASGTTRPERSRPRCSGSWGSTAHGLAGLEARVRGGARGHAGERTLESRRDGPAHRAGHRRRDGAGRRARPGRRRSTARCSTRRRQRCEDAVKANRAKGGTVIVMDPRDGRRLRDGQLPVVRPERFARAAPTGATAQPRGDRRVRAGLGEQGHHRRRGARDRRGRARRATSRCRDPMRVGGFTIHDSHAHPVETMTLGDIIAESSNIGDR